MALKTAILPSHTYTHGLNATYPRVSASQVEVRQRF